MASALGKVAPKSQPARVSKGSPALSLQPVAPSPISGRAIGILAGDGVDGAGLKTVSKALEKAGALVVVIPPHGGEIQGDDGLCGRRSDLPHDPVGRIRCTRRGRGARSADALAVDPYIAVNLGEAFRHYKTIGVVGRWHRRARGVRHRHR